MKKEMGGSVFLLRRYICIERFVRKQWSGLKEMDLKNDLLILDQWKETPTMNCERSSGLVRFV